MTSHDTLQSISLRLKELTEQLMTAKLSKEELEEFETLSRKLYERAIVLNYKAKEEDVYGGQTEQSLSSDLSVEEEVVEDVAEEIEVAPEAETVQPVEESKPEAIESVETETPTDNEGRVQFDFSGGFGTEKPEPVESNREEESAIEESKAEDIQTPQHDEVEEKIIEEEVKEEVTEDTIVEEKGIDNDKTAMFYKRFSKYNQEARGDKLGTSKINSLNGAIGLNDRLQFISELFQGDSNAYNSAIGQLDELGSNEAALIKLSEIAAQNEWENDSSTVDEFAHFITRRYVD
ncbi:hypothetical protein [Brumimicrobium aurantiacum]|uniref:Uncharacterized protein n=1 Tax=Brumimicrobium aurantiacum TaxID=1737063 RepID=A0A3E1F2N1_9FLAO|nr:hypothetical protein [Brumimicrobium aurantiacum]RFC55967.1 hypothetical protein DXU93_03250 [Brumimicrobium aurantiacum]